MPWRVISGVSVYRPRASSALISTLARIARSMISVLSVECSAKRHKPVGDQDDRALPRHRRHAANQILDHAHRQARLVIAEIQFLLRRLLGHLLRRGHIGIRFAHDMTSSVAASSTVGSCLFWIRSAM